MISVILINWNGWADTIACIQSLLNSTAVNARIIVVDNGSTDDSLLTLEFWAKRQFELIPQGEIVEHFSLDGVKKPRHVKFGRYGETNGSFYGFEDAEEYIVSNEPTVYVVDGGRNGGFGYGCNVGMRLGHLLGSSGYWLLNNDCVVNPETLGLVTQRIKQSPHIIFGTILKYYFYPDRIQAVGGGRFNKVTGSVKTNTNLKDVRPINFINGASMAISDLCYKDVGGFDESIFMYFEENDFCIRAANAGYHFDVIKSDVFHKLGGSQGNTASINAWTQVLINKHYVLSKHIGWGSWMIFFYMSLLFRSLLPIGEKNARIGARRTLKRLFFDCKNQ